MSEELDKLGIAFVWAEHQAIKDCEFGGGNVSDHWATIMTDEIERLQPELTAKTDIIAELNAENVRLQGERNELKVALSSQIAAPDAFYSNENKTVTEKSIELLERLL